MGKKLYVRNLGELIDSSVLEELFTTVGDVESSVVEIDSSTGTERRVGYIQMATEQQALDCIDRFHGQEKNGLRLIVTEDKPHVPNPNYQKAKRARSANQKSKARI